MLRVKFRQETNPYKNNEILGMMALGTKLIRMEVGMTLLTLKLCA